MSSTQSETGTSYDDLEPAKLPEPIAMPLPQMPRLEDYADTAQYESAWKAFRAQMEHLRPGVGEDAINAELTSALRECTKVYRITEIGNDS